MGPHGGLAGLGLGLAGLGDGLPDVGLGVGLGLVGLGDWLGATKLGSKHPGPPNRLTQMNTRPGDSHQDLHKHLIIVAMLHCTTWVTENRPMDTWGMGKPH